MVVLLTDTFIVIFPILRAHHKSKRFRHHGTVRFRESLVDNIARAMKALDILGKIARNGCWQATNKKLAQQQSVGLACREFRKPLQASMLACKLEASWGTLLACKNKQNKFLSFQLRYTRKASDSSWSDLSKG